MKFTSILQPFLTALILTISNGLFGQGYYYQFSQSTGTYTDLVNATILSTDLSAPNYDYYTPDGFKLYGKELTNSLRVGRSGWAENYTDDYFITYNPFYPFKGFVANADKSSISAKTEMTAQDTIVKIQWKNVNIAGHPATDSINVQLWLYKKSRAIEFHYGPSNYTPGTDDTIQITTVLLSSDFVIDYENHQVTGSSTNVSDNFDSLSVHPYIGAVPNGTIFRFTHTATGIEEVANMNRIQIFPNPADNAVFVKTQGVSKYTIRDISGNALIAGTINKYGTVNISSLYRGIYLLEVSNQTIKLVKH